MKRCNILKYGFLTFLFAMLMPVFAYADLGSNAPKIFWDKNNPYHQPFSTTYYYGSGDINLDAVVNSSDITAMQEIISGTRTANIMADVNGDGIFNASDLTLLTNAVNNQGILPGWWNSLTTKQAREDWVLKMMALDKTDNNPWGRNYTCNSFAAQTAIKFTYSRWNLERTFLSGGQTVYNLPMYTVSTLAPGWGHSINAILVGDNPLNFDDWLFLEPQRDWTVKPGDQSMPDGSRVIIDALKSVFSSGYTASSIVEFSGNKSGSTLTTYSSSLILTRPAVGTSTIQNTEDRWSPKILKKGNGYLMFEQMRDDLSRTTDIHITSMPYAASAAPLSITDSEYASRLIDTCVASDGTTHVIWNSTYIEPGVDMKHSTMHCGVYYGTLNPDTGTVSNKTWIADTGAPVLSGRILCAPNGTIHVLIFDVYAESINWYKKSGSSWSASSKIVENLSYVTSVLSAEDFRDLFNYFCDAAVTADSEVILSWIGVNTANDTNTIYYKKYTPSTDTWGTMAPVYSGTGTSKPAGVSMAWDGSNIQIAFWNVGSGSPWAHYYRGNIYATTLSGTAWSTPLCLDSSGQATSATIVSDGNGKSCVVWDKRVDTIAKPVYSIKSGSGNWESPVEVNVRTGAEAFYPDAAFTENNNLYLCWSSRNFETIEVETYRVPSYNSFDPSNPQTKPPVLYYDFDQGKPLDMSGNNNNGAFTSGIISASTAGVRNNSLIITGSPFYINTPDSDSLDFGTGDMSISCWFKTTQNNAKLINKKSSTGVGFSLEIYNGVPLMQISDPSGGVFNYYDSSIPKINTNVWHLITVTVDRDSSTGVKIYVDGVLKVTGNALYRTGNISNTGVLKIGADTSGTIFIGEMDELRLYNRVLLDSEIQTLYSDYFNILKLSFDGNLSDVSGNGNSIDSSFAMFAAGAKNTALNCNAGSTASIAHNPTQNLGTDDFSVAFWMKRAGAPTGVEVILEKFDYTVYNGYSISVTNNQICLLVAESSYKNMGYNFSGSFMNTLYDNQYHHITLTVDRDLGAGGVKLYIDGVQAGQFSSQGLTTINASNTQFLTVGRNHYLGQQYKGSLDELNIYGKVLTPAEITAKFNEGNQ